MTEDKMHKIEIAIVKTQCDVEHIKSRIDEGISKKITEIFNMLNKIVPKVEENSYWVGAIKSSVIWFARAGIVIIGIGGVAVFFFFKKGP